MLPDRELDARVTAAAPVRDADLPDLPEGFLRTLRAEGGDRTEPASVLAARQLVADAHEARTAPRARRRRPSRGVLARVGAGVLGVAAAGTAVVLVRASGHDAPPGAGPAPTSQAPATAAPTDPPGGLQLVATQRFSFPFSLDPAPKGLTPSLALFGGPTPSGFDPPGWRADYRSARNPGFTFTVTATDPRIPEPGVSEAPMGTVTDTGTTSVRGVPAAFDSGTHNPPSCRYAPSTPIQTREPGQVCSSTFAELYWQRVDGRWVHVWGDGDTYGALAALKKVAASIVDRPQPVPLQVGLSPAGWSVSSYEDGSALTLISDTEPSISNRISVSLQERWRRITKPADVLQGMTDGNPVEQVTVKGLPAELVSVPDHFTGSGNRGRETPRRMWDLAAQIPGGPVFLLQAPDSLSREDVLAMGEQLIYTP
jgi:hypothetical protein